MALKDSGEGKSSQWQDLGQDPGEMGRVADLYQLTDYEWFGWLVKDLEGTQVENQCQHSLGKRSVDRFIRVGTQCAGICVPYELSPKGDARIVRFY